MRVQQQKPPRLGVRTGPDGIARCVATNKRCLSYRQAREKVANAGRYRRQDHVEEYHCGSCGSWHFGHPSR